MSGKITLVLLGLGAAAMVWQLATVAVWFKLTRLLLQQTSGIDLPAQVN